MTDIATTTTRTAERIDLSATTTLLCDADDNLFPSEAPAFVASTEVTNAFSARLGMDRTYTPDELRRATMGKNFRSTALMLAEEAGVRVDVLNADDVPPVTSLPIGEPGDPISGFEMERWVREEKGAVSRYLRENLRPDPAVQEPLQRLGRQYDLAVVSSSALARLAASFTATGLDELLPRHVRYSAEDSPPTPTSKPDPTVYLLACERLSIAPEQALAIEDSVAGATSAIRAGIPTVGNLQFVTPAEREERIELFADLGVVAIVDSWSDLEARAAA